MNQSLQLTLLLSITMLVVTGCRPEQLPTQYNQWSLGDVYVSDADIEKTTTLCSEAKALGQTRQKIYTVQFPQAYGCDFNEDGIGDAVNAQGNGSRIDGKVRARKEQSHKVVIPSSATICDADFNFQDQSMQYDDEIFLTVNNTVLMASTNYSTESGSRFYKDGLKINDLGHMKYKWSGENGLYNLKYGQAITPKYCLGLYSGDAGYDQKCSVPPTENNGAGRFKLDIPSEEIIKIGLSTNSKVMDFGFISTGDNDYGDCEHSAYSFDITVEYIE